MLRRPHGLQSHSEQEGKRTRRTPETVEAVRERIFRDAGLPCRQMAKEAHVDEQTTRGVAREDPDMTLCTLWKSADLSVP